MKNEFRYWEINQLEKDVVEAHLKLINLRNEDDSYGTAESKETHVILTYNAIEAFVEEGLPLDSPRLKSSLAWLKDNSDRLTNEIVGFTFRLLAHKYTEGYCDRFSLDLKHIEQLVFSDDYKEPSFLTCFEIFPFIALDVLSTVKQNDDSCLCNLFEFILNDTNRYTNPKDLSYGLYLCHLYLSKGYDCSGTIQKIFDKYLLCLTETSSPDGIFGRGIIDTAFTIINIYRLPKECLDDVFIQTIERATIPKIISYIQKMIRDDFSNVNNNEIPNEIKKNEKNTKIYALSVLIRAVFVCQENRLLFINRWLSEHLRRVYMDFDETFEGQACLCKDFEKVSKEKEALCLHLDNIKEKNRILYRYKVGAYFFLFTTIGFGAEKIIKALPASFFNIQNHTLIDYLGALGIMPLGYELIRRFFKKISGGHVEK